MDAARGAFYRIHDIGEKTGHIDAILRRLDFHPLSVNLLATVARQNRWDNNRLVEEWEEHQTGVLQTEHSKSLAVTIELSLASPMFQQLGPDARGLLGVIAFFPQGVDEKNLEWLFPTISNRKTTFDKFCILSLTHRNNGFITMLAPLRDYLCPKDPMTATLLSATKDLYTARLSAVVNHTGPASEDERWITSEDANIEHLLDVFSSADPNSDNIWGSCEDFICHLQTHKPRQTVLGPKFERLPDDHRRKPSGLFETAALLNLLGKVEDGKRLLLYALKLWRDRRDSDDWVARTLRCLAETNHKLGLIEEGTQQAKEGLEVFERLGDAVGQAECLVRLASLLLQTNQFDAAEEATIRSINLLGEGQEFRLCDSHRVLGDIYSAKMEGGKAIHHHEIALRIAGAFNWYDQLFWTHDTLARLLGEKGEFDKAHIHINQAKEHAVDNGYWLAHAKEVHGWIWYLQGRHEDAVAEALGAIEMYGKLGLAKEQEDCKYFLQHIEQSTNKL